MGKLQINMLGASFKVQAKEDDAYLEKLLSYYKDITQAVQDSGVTNFLQASILSGITLVDELYKEKQKNASLLKKLEETQENQQTDEENAQELASIMIEKLSRVLEDESGKSKGLEIEADSDFEAGEGEGEYEGLEDNSGLEPGQDLYE